MAQQNDWKERLGMVYSTSSDFQFENNEEETPETLPAQKQTLYVELDRKGRKGKSATLITNFVGSDADLKNLAKTLKTKCGVGGSSRGGEILIQGDVAKKVMELLAEMGYKVKRIGG